MGTEKLYRLEVTIVVYAETRPVADRFSRMISEFADDTFVRDIASVQTRIQPPINEEGK